jgi:tetratricopeptide (TPR) repeat protein
MLSKTDATMVAAISAKTTGQDTKTLIASAKGSLGSMDTATVRLYGQFNKAIAKNNLILPAGSNAFYYYKELTEKNRKNAALNNDVRRSLVARLEDAAQKVLNKYISQEAVTEADYTLARQELDTALTLISKDHSRYNGMLSRKLFLQSNILGCTCNKDDVTPEVAEASLNLLRQAVALEPDASYLYNSMGNAHFYGRKYDSAILNYDKAIQLAPTWAYPVNNLGTAYAARKRYDKAFQMYEAGAKLTPMDPHAPNLIGNLYMELRKYDQAIEAYKKVLTIDSGEYIYNNLGTAYFIKKDYKTAASYHDRAVVLDSMNGLKLGNWYMSLKQYGTAKRYYSTFLTYLKWDHLLNSFKYEPQYTTIDASGTVTTFDPHNPQNHDLEYVYKQLATIAKANQEPALSYFYSGCGYYWGHKNAKALELYERAAKSGLKLKPGETSDLEIEPMHIVSRNEGKYSAEKWADVLDKIIIK